MVTHEWKRMVLAFLFNKENKQELNEESVAIIEPATPTVQFKNNTPIVPTPTKTTLPPRAKTSTINNSSTRTPAVVSVPREEEPKTVTTNHQTKLPVPT